MKTAARAFLSLAFLLFYCEGWADANKGELFGYRIADKYGLTKSTSWRWEDNAYKGAMLVTADRPNKPEGIGAVYLVVSPKSFTIVEIHSVNVFSSEAARKQFVMKFGETLRNLYGSQNCQLVTDPVQPLFCILGDKRYALAIETFDDNVAIRIRPWTNGGNQLKKQLDQEIADSLRERANQSDLRKGL
jgi:hypothetical protein